MRGEGWRRWASVGGAGRRTLCLTPTKTLSTILDRCKCQNETKETVRRRCSHQPPLPNRTETEPEPKPNRSSSPGERQTEIVAPQFVWGIDANFLSRVNCRRNFTKIDRKWRMKMEPTFDQSLFNFKRNAFVWIIDQKRTKNGQKLSEI